MGRRKPRAGWWIHRHVTLTKPRRYRCWVMRWVGPDGKKCQESTQCETLAAATGKARKKSQELQKVVLEPNDEIEDISWAGFWHRYERDHLGRKPGGAGTRRALATPRRTYERLMHPGFMSEVTTKSIARFRKKLEAEMLAKYKVVCPATITSYLKQLRAGFNWGARHGLMRPVIVNIQLSRKEPC